MKRIELKFDITSLSIKNLIRELKLCKLHERRKIYSIYYDTDKYKFFYDGIEGIRPRKKIRIRSYDLKNFQLEAKITTFENKLKHSKKLQNFKKYNLSNINFNKYRMNIYNEKVNPTLSVFYERSYYFNQIGRFTIDTDIRYKKNLSTDFSINYISQKKIILECKSLNLNTKYIFNSLYNLKEHAFSKYINGFSLTHSIKI